MRWPFKKRDWTEDFQVGLRAIQVSLYTKLRSQYSQSMDGESASVLAAQVSNYLKGENIAILIENTDEPLKSQIARIKDQIPEYAAKEMADSRSTREAIVATLRMMELYRFMKFGDGYMQSDEHRRIFELLAPYGPEFPDEIKPDKYLDIARRYKEERFPNG